MSLKKTFTIFVLLVMVLILTGCSQESPKLEDKTKNELEYMSVKLINILNRLNNITFENYKVTAEKVELSKESAESEKSSKSSNSQSTEENSSQEKESKESNNIIIVSQMSPNTILNPVTTEIDWPTLKNEIENIYFSWSTILLDLNQLDVTNDYILGFSSDLDKATTYIKNEDKTNALQAVSSLYGYLPKYAEKINKEDLMYFNVFKTKSYLINAYSLASVEDWDGVIIEINKAYETYKTIITNATFEYKNPYRINKVYVLINELKNSLNKAKDREIFLIHYRNLMEEINEI